jgi:hypothetical protein
MPIPGGAARLVPVVAGFVAAGLFGVVAVACCGGRIACVLGAAEAVPSKAAVVNAEEIAKT